MKIISIELILRFQITNHCTHTTILLTCTLHSTQFNSENLRSFFHLMLKTFHELCYFSNFSQRPFVTYCHLKENHHVMVCIFHFASLQLQKMHLHNLFFIDHVEKSTKTKKCYDQFLKLIKLIKLYFCKHLFFRSDKLISIFYMLYLKIFYFFLLNFLSIGKHFSCQLIQSNRFNLLTFCSSQILANILNFLPQPFDF